MKDIASERNIVSLEKQVSLLCKGLIYISETDAAVEPFYFANSSGRSFTEVLAEIKSKFGRNARRATPAEFFDRLTTEQPWHTPLQQRTVEKFKKLRSLLETELTDLSVYRFGTIRVEILVVGSDNAGNAVGIKTRAVET